MRLGSVRVRWLRSDQVVLAVEVVSPGSETTDRVVKPLQYAQAGIAHYWRIETEPQVVVVTYRLGAGPTYVHTGCSAPTPPWPGLEWAAVEVSPIADPEAGW